MRYFDNSATTYPKPSAVVRAVEQAMRLYGANPGRSGHDLSLQTAIQVYNCREAAAELFHAAEPNHVVFTGNCTQGLNYCIKGLLKPGDHLLISDLEHNAVLRPVHTLKERGIIEYDVVKTGPEPEQTVRRYEQLIRPNTRLICATHASNVFGLVLPIRQLGELAHSHGIYFLVDAAQTAGILPVKMDEMQIDFLCTAGHKGLYGPMGTGLMITPHGEMLDTTVEGGTGSMSMEYRQPSAMPDRFESGTVNAPGIVGLHAGILFVERQGIDRLYRHEMELMQFLYHQLERDPNVALYTDAPQLGRMVPVLSFNIKGQSSEDTVSRLNRMGFALRGGLHCAPLAHSKMGTLERGTCRISFGAFNTFEELERLISAIKKISG